MKVAAKRKPISKAIRHEIFKRDSFTCQYCGKSAPDVVLEIEHIIPISKGGDNETLNLITACFDCNRGKGSKLLSDDTIIKKQKKQLKELNEKKQQLKLLIEWKKELLTLENQTLEYALQYWADKTKKSNRVLSETGKAKMKKFIKTYGVKEVFAAIDIVESQYFYKAGNSITPDEYVDGFQKIGGICRNRKLYPNSSEIQYLIGIIKNVFTSYSYYQAVKYLQKAFDKGLTFEYLKEMILDFSSWRYFIEALIEEVEG